MTKSRTCAAFAVLATMLDIMMGLFAERVWLKRCFSTGVLKLTLEWYNIKREEDAKPFDELITKASINSIPYSILNP